MTGSKLAPEGYEVIPNVFDEHAIAGLRGHCSEFKFSAGTRNLLDHAWARELAHETKVKTYADLLLGKRATPVRAILFDKRPGTNWNLGWHQDTKIAVRLLKGGHRSGKDFPSIKGYSAWSVKEGTLHVKPPVEVLESMLAVRIHLDDCPESNGPLSVVPNSHNRGLINADEARNLVASNGVRACLCKAGDIVLMRPLILHSSPKATLPTHRRVIHIEYCSSTLPSPIAWGFEPVPIG